MSLADTQPCPTPNRVGTSILSLYAATVFAWGFSWIAMKGQVGSVAPEVSVFWRFVLASAVMMALTALRGQKLRFPAKDHIRFALLGVFLFSTNFTLFYYGAIRLPSGLLAVVFSTASIFNLILSFVFFGQRPNLVTLAAGVLGFGGVGLMFWHTIAGAEFNHEALVGLAFCIGGTLSFCLGNMVSASTQKRGIGVFSASSWGMVYGMVYLGMFAALRGQSFAIDWTVPYIGSLVYLAVIASVLAFASYLTLLGQIGSARAGYATVLFPVVALAVSTLAEGYLWTATGFAGLACVMAGNVLMLRKR